MSRTLRVVVVDDSPVLREMIVAYLDREPDLQVVRTFDSVGALLDAAQALRPDVVVLDNQMPGGDGLSALPGLRDRCPAARIVMWSADSGVAARALAGGADAFVDKSQPFVAVVTAALDGVVR